MDAGTGYAIFKAVDNKMEQRGSTTAIAPAVLGLFILADVLRPRFPDVRWHMFYPAMACGMVNAVSAEKGNAVTCMVTGHRTSQHCSFVCSATVDCCHRLRTRIAKHLDLQWIANRLAVCFWQS